MAENEELTQKLNRASNSIAKTLKDFLNKVMNSGTVTYAELSANLSPVVDRLELLGVDENNPVPENPLSQQELATGQPVAQESQAPPQAKVRKQVAQPSADQSGTQPVQPQNTPGLEGTGVVTNPQQK